ncbi:MAG: hypothetical protein H0X66_14785 [Verrucomicrobia bacterium]|nr:hypothetical protein [Verrucomicrobiota bacterium]
MKRTLLMLFVAAAFVGCERADRVDEPAGADRDIQMDQRGYDTNGTNPSVSPGGAGVDQQGTGNP